MIFLMKTLSREVYSRLRRVLNISMILLEVNLNIIEEYKRCFPDIHIGYSGHELGYIPTLGGIHKLCDPKKLF